MKQTSVRIELIKQVEQYLVARLEEPFPYLKHLAKEFIISQTALRLHFKLVHNCTMRQFFMKRKMELARTMIESKGVNVSTTSRQLGFLKLTNFINCFKQAHGVTPGSLKPLKLQSNDGDILR